MNDRQQRRRILVICTAGGFLLLMLLLVALLSPSPRDQAGDITLRTGTTDGTARALETGAEKQSPSGFSLGGGDLVSLAWRLGLVVVIIAASIAGLRWWGRKTAGPRSVTGFLRVVDTLAISNGRSVHLLAIGDRVIAIGATAQQVTWLSDLTEDESAKVLREAGTTGENSLAGFAAELFQTMRRERAGGRPDSASVTIGGPSARTRD